VRRSAEPTPGRTWCVEREWAGFRFVLSTGRRAWLARVKRGSPAFDALDAWHRGRWRRGESALGCSFEASDDEARELLVGIGVLHEAGVAGAKR
jgi:hypothetical protein